MRFDIINHLVLSLPSTDLPVVRELKEQFKRNGNVEAALNGMSDHVTRNLLHGISKFGKTVQALQEVRYSVRAI